MTAAQAQYTVDAYEDTAFLTNSDGYDVAYLSRLRPAHDRSGFCAPAEHALGDDEWQRLVNLVAEAPRLLSLVIEYQQEARKLGWGCDTLDAAASASIAAIEAHIKHS
jgi:hypothetical protein